jgi:hypothetical protein
MSTETTLRVSLSTWIALLVRALDHDPYGAGARLRAVVEGSRARITLDDETVLVAVEGGELVIGPDDPASPVDGYGATTSGTVVALLAGDLEVLAAVEQGEIDIVGSVEETTRMFAAIELLLDGSTRLPGLRRLADAFVAERSSGRRPKRSRNGSAAEMAALARLDLLEDDPRVEGEGHR